MEACGSRGDESNDSGVLGTGTGNSRAGTDNDEAGTNEDDEAGTDEGEDDEGRPGALIDEDEDGRAREVNEKCGADEMSFTEAAA